MSANQELEKLRNIREELETEACSLEEQQSSLANIVMALEEKIIIEELKMEKAAIEELKNRNRASKAAIVKLKSKKKKLETKLDKALGKLEEATSEHQEVSPPEENEEIADGGVVVEAIDGDVLEEQLELTVEDSSKQGKRKRRFF
jgi:hypothetical protein